MVLWLNWEGVCLTSVNEKLVIFGRSNLLRWHDKSADSLGVGLITSGPVDVSAQHEITGTADVIQEMHRKSGWRFSVVVKRSCLGLIVQSPRIHYGIDCVSIQDVYLCHNAALYYHPPPTKKQQNKTKSKKNNRTAESHFCLPQHCFVYFEERLQRDRPARRFAWCSPWPAGHCTTPECSTLLSIYFQKHPLFISPLYPRRCITVA